MLSNHSGRLMGDTHFGLGFSIVTPANTDDIRNVGTFRGEVPLQLLIGPTLKKI